MKVSDLMEDLETGDRSMEHLKEEPKQFGFPTIEELQRAYGLGNQFAPPSYLGMQQALQSPGMNWAISTNGAGSFRPPAGLGEWQSLERVFNER